MATKIGSLLISLGLDSGEFKSGLDQAEKQFNRSVKGFEKLGDKISGLGSKLSIGITAPFVAFGVASVKAATESRDAMAQVEAALKSMGGAAGRTKDQLSNLATKQMRSSLYDDDEILRKVTANLLTFGKVSGDTFDKAQQAALDLSARLGTDLQGSAVMLGKALNDPIKGVTALTRVGVSFTAQQKEQIKTMAESGNVAGAQNLILAELTKQYGGSAKAALDAAGPMAKLKKNFDEISETVGAAILPAIERLVPYIQRAADAFANLSPGMQTTVVAAAAVAAALGPVLVVVGGLIKFAAPMLAFVKTTAALAALQPTLAAGAGVWAAGLGSILASLAPIAAAATAAYIVWKNWDDIAPRLTPIIGNLRDIAEILGLIAPKAKDAGDKSQDATSDMEDLGNAAKTASAKFQSWADAFDEYNARTAASARENGTTIQAGLRDLWNGFESFVQRLNGWGQRFKSIITEAMGIGANIVLGIARGIRQAPEAVWNALKSVISSGITNAKAFLGIKSPSRVFMEIGAFIGDGLAIGIETGKKKVDAATRKLTEAARKAAEEVRDLFARLFPEVGASRTFGRERGIIDASKLSDAAKEEARYRLNREYSGGGGPVDVFTNDGPLDVTKGLDDVLSALETFKRRAGSTTVNVAKSFKDMADATVQSLSNLANSIKGGGFLGILEAVIGLGLQLGSIGAFGSKIASRINAPKVPGYANGTNFHPGGLAVVGERGPELVSMPRGSRVTPNGQWGGGQKLQVEVIANNNGFGAIVRNYAGQVVAEAAPALMDGGAQVAQSRMNYRSTRRVA